MRATALKAPTPDLHGRSARCVAETVERAQGLTKVEI
jgi:hypothetical protein